jgi:eukaryotic-like serine/threonine-protein kinase
LALTIGDEQESDIFILDLAREGPPRPLTFDPGIDAGPVWTPNGQRIVFSSGGAGLAQNLFIRAADGSGTAERLTTSQNFQTPSFITLDGTGIVGYEMTAKTASDIVRFPLKSSTSRPAPGPDSDSSPSQSVPLIRTTFIESNPEISRDGRYIAYQSNESGRYEIYVRRFPDVDTGGRWQPSSGGGGTRPAWARNGKDLFYLDLENKLTAVPVQTAQGTFAFGSPAKVLDTAYAESLQSARPYDVSADGQRFLMIKGDLPADRAARPGGFVVVLNWFEEVKGKLAAESAR